MKKNFMNLVLSIVFLIPAAGAAWQAPYEFPEEQRPYALWVHSENCVYVKTASELIYRWNGQDWMEIETPVSGYVDHLVGFDDFIVMSRGARFYWYDSGVWNSVRLADDEDNRYTCIAGNSRENVYVMITDGVFRYSNGEWIQILTGDDMENSRAFKSIFLTRENDLYVIGQNYTYEDTWWMGFRVRLYFDQEPSCYKMAGDTLVSFLNTGDDESAEIIGGWSTENLYLWNHCYRGFGLGKVIHHNGEFFTCVADYPRMLQRHGSTKDGNNLIFSDDNQFVVWEGLIPRLLDPLAFEDGKHRSWYDLRVDGISVTDFWILSVQNKELYRWMGPLPERPYKTGAFMKMDDHRVHAGETFRLQLAACNASLEPIAADVYMCMMLFGLNGLWFWPNWTQEPSEIQPVRVNLDPYGVEYFDVFNLVWPESDAGIDGIFMSLMVSESGKLSELQYLNFSVR